MPTEADWQAWVRAEAEARGIICYHAPDSRQTAPGLPDLILAGRGVAFAELKSPRGILRPEQRRFINRAALGGVAVYVWAPGDEVEVLAVLDALALEPVAAPAPEADAGDDELPDVLHDMPRGADRDRAIAAWRRDQKARQAHRTRQEAR